MKKKDYEIRKNQMVAKRMIPKLEDEISALEKKRPYLAGTSRKKLNLELKEKRSELRRLKRIASSKIPASAYALPSRPKRRVFVQTRSSQQRPVQGGSVTPK